MHHPLTSEVLSRFHRTLVEEIRSSRPEYLSRPFTVAEIYQNLVPYRTHRDRIGVEMNGDYEDALLRLLAGEGDYLVLESDHARRELQGELESSNPNTGLFREFAAADVRLNPARLPSSSPGAEPAAGDGGVSDHEDDGARPSPHDLFGDSVLLDLSEEDRAVAVEDLAPEPPSPSGTPRGSGGRASHASPRAPEPERSGAAVHATEVPGVPAAGGECRWCRGTLPHRENLNYCPFCGASAHSVPCSGCGEELELDWRFCIVCGTEAAEAG